MNKWTAGSLVGALLASNVAFATESAEVKNQAMSEEKQVISFFSAMCVQTGGRAEMIEKKLGKALDQIDKRTVTEEYTMEQTEDVWTVASATAGKPYILSVTKNGTCYVGFNPADQIKMRQEFKSFVAEQAVAIKSKAESVAPLMDVPQEVSMDFYDIKLPGTEHKIKFSFAAPKDNSKRSTMTIASE